MTAEGKAITFYRCNLFLLFLHHLHRWKTGQIWPVGRKWCRFTNASENFAGPPPNLGHKKHQILHLFRDFRHHVSLERNVAWTNKNASSIYNVPPKSWPTFRDLWPRNGWDPFAYCDPPFGGHYVATIKVVTCLVIVILNAFFKLQWHCSATIINSSFLPCSINEQNSEFLNLVDLLNMAANY